MPYTVAVSFDKFYQNINLSGDHREAANRRRDDIVKTLKKNLNVIEAFSSGSIPRYTALKDHADLDVMVALHYGDHIKGRKPSEVLQEVRNLLSEYKTNVRKNGQAVTLYYVTWPNVDIVPCSRTVDDNGNVTSYSIPDMNTEQWITSKPKNHTSNMTSHAGKCGSNFKRAITMVKHWNRTHSSYLQSYHIEAMALRIFDSSMTDISWDVFKFFDEAVKLMDTYIWYEGAFVDDYFTYDKKQEAKKRLETARDKARSAWAKTYGDDNDHEGAIKIWRQIFGDRYPSYG